MLSYQFLAFYRENLTSFPRKSPSTVSFPTSSCDKRSFLRLTTLPIQGSHPTAALCPSGQTLTLNLTLAFVPAIDAMPGRRGFGGPELTEALYVRFLTCSFIFSALFIVVLMIMQNKIRVTEQEWSFLGVFFYFFVLIYVVPILDEKCTVGFGILEENFRIIFFLKQEKYL